MSSDPVLEVSGASAYSLDKARIRRLTAAAAPRYDRAAWLPRRAADSLMEHLAPVRLRPGRILDAGAGTGICAALLARRFPRARLLCLDSCAPMLRRARPRAPRWLSKRALACGDAEHLPLADASIDLLVSSLMLPACPRPDAVLAEFHRVLAPGGLLMFASLGPDTLWELRESWRAADGNVHVHAFFDMHDLGDALLRAGLRDVVMDTERVTGHYADLATLVRELRDLGAGNAAAGRARGLTTPRRLKTLSAAYEQLREPDGLPASFELVFGHAWRAPARSVRVSAELQAPGSRNMS